MRLGRRVLDDVELRVTGPVQRHHELPSPEGTRDRAELVDFWSKVEKRHDELITRDCCLDVVELVAQRIRNPVHIDLDRRTICR